MRRDVGASKETLTTDHGHLARNQISSFTVDRANNEMNLQDFECGSIVSETEKDGDSVVSGDFKLITSKPMTRIKQKGVVISEVNGPDG